VRGLGTHARPRHALPRPSPDPNPNPNPNPEQVAVFPLLKNKPELVAKAEALHAKLQRRYHVAYDAAGAIGRLG